MADKERTKRKVQNIQKGLGVTADGVYGPVTRSSLMDEFRAPMGEAVKFAENNPRNHGVLSVKTENPGAVLDESVVNNLDRFMAGRQSSDNWDNSATPKFVDFMRERWAPVNADHPSVRVTPKENELNPNWAPNVRAYLKQQYPKEYEKWRAMNLVKTPLSQFEAVA